MIVNRLILFKLNPANKLALKSVFSINNVLSVNTQTGRVNQAGQNEQKQSVFLLNQRYYSDVPQTAAAAAASASGSNKPDVAKPALPEMDKSLKEMEKNMIKVQENLTDPIAARQANFKLSNISFLKEPQKNSQLYDTYVDPYVKLMRLNSLAPVHLVYWPSAWAILGSASYLQTTPDFYMLGLFALGALSMRTAGCIVNDIWDRNIDKQVERVIMTTIKIFL